MGQEKRMTRAQGDVNELGRIEGERWGERPRRGCGVPSKDKIKRTQPHCHV